MKCLMMPGAMSVEEGLELHLQLVPENDEDVRLIKKLEELRSRQVSVAGGVAVIDIVNLPKRDAIR